MPELRRDVTTGRWVVVASKRARRPHDVIPKPRPPRAAAPNRRVCPFCPGNEELTPPPVRVVGATTRSWLLRVCPNRFPALEPGARAARATRPPFFERAGARGYHEVIIETPQHDTDLRRLDQASVERVVAAYAERDRDLRARPGIAYVVVFRNHGPEAGASLEHPHSQVAAMPAVPPEAGLRLETAKRYFEENGGSLYSHLVEAETKAGERIVEATEDLLVLCPFASRLPFETWIVPRRPAPTLGRERDSVLAALAGALARTLRRIDRAAADPPYNLIVYSAPAQLETVPWFSWHIQIVPRVATPAGFELATGLSINVVRPEEAAEFLRRTQADNDS